MRALIVLDGVWVALLLVFGGLLYHEGAERAELKKEAERIRRELGLIERALLRAGEAEPDRADEPIPASVYGKFIEGGPSRLREKGLDPFGNAYGPLRPGERPGVPSASFERLRNVAGPDFWVPYPVGP